MSQQQQTPNPFRTAWAYGYSIYWGVPLSFIKFPRPDAPARQFLSWVYYASISQNSRNCSFIGRNIQKELKKRYYNETHQLHTFNKTWIKSAIRTNRKIASQYHSPEKGKPKGSENNIEKSSLNIPPAQREVKPLNVNEENNQTAEPPIIHKGSILSPSAPIYYPSDTLSDEKSPSTILPPGNQPKGNTCYVVWQTPIAIYQFTSSMMIHVVCIMIDNFEIFKKSPKILQVWTEISQFYGVENWNYTMNVMAKSLRNNEYLWITIFQTSLGFRPVRPFQHVLQELLEEWAVTGVSLEQIKVFTKAPGIASFTVRSLLTSNIK